MKTSVQTGLDLSDAISQLCYKFQMFGQFGSSVWAEGLGIVDFIMTFTNLKLLPKIPNSDALLLLKS